MQSLSIALRATTIVLGIAALASLVNRLVADSGLRFWLLMKQQTIPGSLWGVSALESMTYGLSAILICFFVARGYWRELFPERIKLSWLLVCLVLGILFAEFLSSPMHAYLFGVFFGKPVFSGGAISDTFVGAIFYGISGYKLIFTMSAFATIIISPIVEELTDRGILFKQAEGLPLWQIAILSFVVFCFSHYAIGGMAKVLAVVPAALLFIGIRLKTGSFVYAVAAHTAVNLTAMLKLQVL